MPSISPNSFQEICKIFYTIVIIYIISLQTEYISGSEFEGQLTFAVFHSLSEGPEAVFTQRGVIVVHSIKNQDVTYKDTAALSPGDIAKLRKLAQENKKYKIKVTPQSGPEDVNSVTSFMRACSLYESELSDKLTMALDQTGALLGVSIVGERSQCEGISGLVLDRTNFNTSVEMLQTVTGPVPDTQTYISRIEMEKADKARGDHSDNRSFFAKYWMYIVPLVIFLLISGASQPDSQGGAGAAATR